MNRETVTSKQMSSWALAALAAPIVQTASGASWVSVALLTIACLAVCWGVEFFKVAQKDAGWQRALRFLWISAAIVQILYWIEICWPNYHSPVLPVAVIALAVWASGKGKTTAARTSNVIRFFLAFLIGIVLLSGLWEIRIENLYPQWRMKDAHFIWVMLIPALIPLTTEKKGTIKQKAKVGLYALAVSVITTGVLSVKGALQADAPFYELSRSMAMFGVTRRFESLVASGLTLGYFVLLLFLLEMLKSAAQEDESERGWNRFAPCACAVISAALYLLEFLPDDRIMALSAVVIILIVPALASLRKR